MKANYYYHNSIKNNNYNYLIIIAKYLPFIVIYHDNKSRK